VISVFISYAHADEKLKERFLVHLGALKSEGLIGVWHDVVLLVSSDFIIAFVAFR
jgi:hypothetical protein